MGKGFVYSLNAKYANADHPGDLIFSRENGLLGDHAILVGRSDAERVNRIITFTGQSLTVPPGATALMKLSPDTSEAPDRATWERLKRNHTAQLEPPVGSAQGVALSFGRGRVVMLGEAALLTAQVWRRPGEPDRRSG